MSFTQPHLQPNLESTKYIQPVLHHIAEKLSQCAAGNAVSLLDEPALALQLGLKAAGILGLCPLLHTQLHAGKLALPTHAQTSWRTVLAEQYALTQQRNDKLLTQTQNILQHAHNAGALLMPLKGMDLLARIYDNAALRPTSDIDLLVQPEQFGLVQHAIERAGFALTFLHQRHASFSLPNNRVVSTFGEHPDNPIKVELHMHTRQAPPIGYFDLAPPLWASAHIQTRNGRAPAAYPSNQTLMLYLLAHAAGHSSIRALRFTSLLDVAILAKQFSPTDWDTLRETLHTQQCGWAFVPLQLMRLYFPHAVPVAVLQSAQAHTPFWLRRLMRGKTLSHISMCDLRPTVPHHRSAFAKNAPTLLAFLWRELVPNQTKKRDWQAEQDNAPENLHAAGSNIRRLLRAFNPNGSRIRL